MADKKEYRVVVTEVLRKIVVVKAKDEKEAHQRVCDAWQNGEFLLDSGDFEGAEFHVLDESEETGEKNLAHVEGMDEDGDA